MRKIKIEREYSILIFILFFSGKNPLKINKIRKKGGRGGGDFYRDFSTM
jgi:hypothetical protein